MSPPTRPPKKLLREWNKKLAESGFQDIENKDNDLIVYDSYYFRNKQRPGVEFQESKASYYRMAGYLLHDHVFEDEREKLVWALHTKGDGQRAIISELQRLGHIAHFDYVGGTIRRLAEVMKTKYQGSSSDEQ